MTDQTCNRVTVIHPVTALLSVCRHVSGDVPLVCRAAMEKSHVRQVQTCRLKLREGETSPADDGELQSVVGTETLSVGGFRSMGSVRVIISRCWSEAFPEPTVTIFPLSFRSPSSTRTAADDTQKDETPQIPPRIRTPHSPEKTPEPTVPIRIVSQPLRESSE